MSDHEHCAADIETFSECPLKKAGAYKYAEHESTEILCLFYSFVINGKKGPVHGWVPYDDIPEEVILGACARVDADGNPVITGELHVGSLIPGDIYEWAEEGKEFRAHNAEFEFVNLNGKPGEKIGFPKTKNSQWVCTAAKVSAHSLPRALGYAAEACGTHPKDETMRVYGLITVSEMQHSISVAVHSSLPYPASVFVLLPVLVKRFGYCEALRHINPPSSSGTAKSCTA